MNFTHRCVKTNEGIQKRNERKRVVCKRKERKWLLHLYTRTWLDCKSEIDQRGLIPSTETSYWYDSTICFTDEQA